MVNLIDTGIREAVESVRSPGWPFRRMDETQGKVRCHWVYLCTGRPSGFFLIRRPYINAAESFLRRAMYGQQVRPAKMALDA